VLLGQKEAGDEWQVRWLAFSLNQAKVEEGGTDVWDDPAMTSARMAVEVGIAVRDGWPERFPAVHRALFAARHDHGLDLRDGKVLADVLAAEGLDPTRVFDEIGVGKPRETFRAEHQTAVDDHQVFGVPTVIVGDRATFVRLVDRPGHDAGDARRAVDRILDLMTGWPNLNEFKHTTIPH